MRDIRTKDKLPRTIRQLDRQRGLQERIRSAGIKGKDVVVKNAEEDKEAVSQSPSDYAIGKVAKNAETLSRESVYQVTGKSRMAVRMLRKRRREATGNESSFDRRAGRGEWQNATPSVKQTGSRKYRTVKPKMKSEEDILHPSQSAMKARFITNKRKPKEEMWHFDTIRSFLLKFIQRTGGKLKSFLGTWKVLAAGSSTAILVILICCICGGALICYSSGSGESVLPVSVEVEAYDPVIRTYARQYGIEEYVQLIKAVMMQESGGLGGDPMQSSEGAYNTRYPRRPNGITNPEYSIQCGVQELKSCLERTGCSSPMDMPKIRLALQGYNYGNGYITWALQRDGGYTEENAVIFSNMMAARLGWTGYGDKEYVAHVLRYYPYGQLIDPGGGAALAEIALTQVGNVGGAPYWSWYGFGSRVEWCACFVSWCGNQCGYIDSGAMPKFSNCSDGARWFKARNRWKDRNYLPSPGDIIFFDWQGDGVTDHVGIVQSCDGRTVYTIEGNSRDSVRQKSYSVGSGSIYGYGIMQN